MAQADAVHSDLRLGVSMGVQDDFDTQVSRNNDRPIAQRMRANGHNDNCIQIGLDDGSAATQGIRSRTCRSGHDQPISGMCIQWPAGDEGFEIQHPPAVATLHNDVIQRRRAARAAVRGTNMGIQQQARFTGEFAMQNPLQAADHFRRRNICQKAEPAAVYTEQRHIDVTCKFRCVKHRAVTANGYDQIGLVGNFRLLDGAGTKCCRYAWARDHRGTGFCQIAHKSRHRFGDAFILVSADEGDGVERLSHALVDYILPEDGRYWLTGWLKLIVANTEPAAKLLAVNNLDIFAMSCQRNFCVSRKS